MKPQCIQAVSSAIGRNITAQEAKNIELKIRDSMRQLAQKDANWKNLSDSERLTQAAAKVGGMLQAEAIRKAKIAADDILKQSREMAMLTDSRYGDLPAIERIDRTVAFFSDQSGIQSINSQGNVLGNLYVGRLTDVLTQTKGGIAAWIDPNLVKGMVKELFGESSGDPLAKKLGKQIADVMEDLRLHFNRAGGDIGKLLDWGLPQSHSAYKLMQFGKDKWVDYVLPRLNRNKYIDENGRPMDDATLVVFLREAYQTITTDGANKIASAGQPKTGGGNSRLTSRHAESRQIHFKDADSWIEYHGEFGGKPFIQLLNGHIRSVARDIALIDRLGSSPEGAMKILLREAKRLDVGNNGMPGYKFNYKQWRINSMFNELTGKLEVGNEKIANLGRAYRSANVSAMLGGTTISSIPDQAMTAKTASVHGIAYRKVFGELVHNLNPASKEDRNLAHSMGIATEDLVGSLSRYLDEGLTTNHGDFAKLANVADLAAGSVMRASLLNHLTQSNKIAIEKMMLNNFWEKTREWDWQTMDAGDKKIFEGGGITQKEWDVFKLVDKATEDSKGTKMLDAQAIYSIPDAELQHLGDPQKIRDDAALKLMTYAYDERGMAVVEGGLRERSLMNLGVPEGSWQGFILRGVMQFKTYAASMLMRHGSRALAQDGFKGKAAYSIPLIAMTTLLGGLVVQLREIKNGNDPTEMWDGEKWYTAGINTDFLKRSFVAGGGLPALGDIIAAGADTTGRDINSFLTGPLGSDFKTALNLTVGNATQLANGVETNAANETFKAVKSKLPAQNLWYTQAATNRLIFDNFQDMIAPGYREKLLRKAEQKYDRTRWLGDFDWGEGFDEVDTPDIGKTIRQ